MSDIEDKILIQEFKNGNKSSLEKIYVKYKNSLFRLIWYYVQNIEDAEDILQMVFEKLIKNIHKYNPQKDVRFKTYLYRISINLCKDFLRHKKILNLIKMDSVKEIAEYDANIEEIEKEEIKSLVRRSVKELPSKYRDVIILIYFEDMKYDEVANILNKPLGTIKSRANYGLKLLRKRLENLKYEV